MKIALIGCGGIARTHAQCFRNVAGGEVHLVAASRTADKARQAAGEIGAQGWLAPYSAALEAPDIAAVLILTPHHTHVELAAEALRRGKHVFLEKPVTRTVAEAEPLARALRENPRLVLMAGENFHFIPAIQQAVEALRAGTIGRLHSVAAHALYCVRAEDWRRRREEMGGGALLDGGVHTIHGLRMLGGEIASVFAMEPAEKWNEMEGEESLQLLLRFVSGATASFYFSWANHGNPLLPDFLVSGTEGAIAVRIRERHNELYKLGQKKPEQVRIGNRFGNRDIYRRHGAEGAITEFLDCIKTGRQPILPLAEGLRDVAVIEAAYRSLTTRKEEKVEPLPAWAG